ncbi:MAG: hypothetical protein ACPG8W_01630 [Candidatus Promineifilaceae bacterium]
MSVEQLKDEFHFVGNKVVFESSEHGSRFTIADAMTEKNAKELVAMLNYAVANGYGK